MSEIKIRKLKRKDRETLSDLLQKFAEKVGNDQILNIIDSTTSESQKENTDESKAIFNKKMITLAIDILKQILDVLDNDVKPFFADLIGCEVSDFDNQDFDVEIQIIEQLVEDKNFVNFFTGASRLYNKISLLKHG